MNLHDAQVVIRTRSASEVLDLAFRVTAAQAKVNLRLSLVLFAPAAVALVALRHGGAPWWALWTIAWIWASFVEGVFTIALGQRLFSPVMSVRAALRATWARFGAYLGGSLLIGLALCLASLFFVLIPISWPRWIFFREALLLENTPVFKLTTRCTKLLARRLRFGYFMWFVLLAAPVLGAVFGELLGQGLCDEVLGLGRPFGSLFEDGGSAWALIGFFATVPWAATARFLGYLDLRTRNDGWDLQVRFAALQASHEAERKIAA